MTDSVLITLVVDEPLIEVFRPTSYAAEHENVLEFACNEIKIHVKHF
jgi:hypothetical protein